MTIAWDTFERAARTAARVQGVPHAQITIIPHRVGGQTADDQRRKAEAALPDIVRRLTTRGEAPA